MTSLPGPEALLGADLTGATGRWRVAQFLASGGIANVYLGQPQPEGSGDPVVLKVLRPEFDDARDFVARFDREAVAALRVRHPNVIQVLAPVQRSGRHSFFPVEHLVGVDLADALASQKRLPAPRALRLVHAIALGLAASHAAGVVHRDVKPENIFLVHEADGREVPKILDFGSAWLDGDSAKSASHRITVSTGFVGTPGYVAPEQAEGHVGHPTADVYSLGVVLYEALEGGPPFRGRSWVETLHLHATQPVPRLRGCSPEVEAVVQAALAKKPEQRPRDMAELAAALREAGASSGG